MSLEEIITQKIAEVGGRLKVRSALNPALWLCAIITLPAIWRFSKLGGNLPNWLIILICAPVAVAVFGFLLFFDRDKLQSEDYQLRKQSLELIHEKGNKFPVLATSIHAITNPDQSLLSNDSKDTEK